MTPLAAGAAAPDFSLQAEDGKRFTNADLAGHTTIFVFYPFAFSAVCSDQFGLYEEVLDEIAARGASVYGVSCDASPSQKAFREQLGVSIAQLSDFEPKGKVCEAFGVLHPGGFAQRAIVVIDGEGTIRFSYQAETPGDLPGVGVLFDGLDAAA